MSIVRVKPEVSPTVWWDHENQVYITLTPGAAFNSKDLVVKECAWAFQVDADEDTPPRRASVSVEDASATPGTRRNR